MGKLRAPSAAVQAASRVVKETIVGSVLSSEDRRG